MSKEQLRYNQYETERSARRAEQKARHKEILTTVREVCKKHKGMADIGEGFVVVDTMKFEIKEV